MRRAPAAPVLCGIVLVLALVACTGGAATPTAAPATAPPATAGATTGLPPAPTLPPTPPTPTVARETPATPTAPTTAGGTATRDTVTVATRRTLTATAPPAPSGEVPPGWLVYRGSLPFVIAYPPNWILDETQLGQGLVYFYAPLADRSTFLVIATTDRPEANPNLDVLRDRWFQSRTRTCARFAVETTRQEAHGGVEFATVGATCDLPGGLAYSYTGIGVRRQVPWIFEFNAPYSVYDVALAEVFGPMVATWNIYDAAR